MRDLAENNGTAAQLAEKYGKAEITIKKFLQRNRAEILELRDEINAGVTGLWATEKINRMAMLQHIVEAAQDHLDALEDAAEEAGVLVNYKEWCRYSDLQVKILHEIAEQMGQIPHVHRTSAPRTPLHASSP